MKLYLFFILPSDSESKENILELSDRECISLYTSSYFMDIYVSKIIF